MSRRIDLTLVWEDAKAMALANRDLLTAIGGMFLLLPLIVGTQFMTQPALPGRGASQQAMMAWYEAYFAANAPVILCVSIVTSFGSLAMLALLLRPERLTVAESLKAALTVLPGYVIASMLQQFAVMAGLMLFLLPGFYLIGRFALIAVVAAAEQQGNPFTILRRAADLGRGHGWRLFGLLAVITIVMLVINILATVVIGVVAALLLPPELAELVMSLVSGLCWTAIFTLIVLVTAAFYRTVTGPAATPWMSER